MSYCKCCGHIVDGQLCEICNFIEPSFSDIASSEKNTLEHAITAHKQTQAYKEGVLSNTVISMNAFQFQWNQKSSKYELMREMELFDRNLTGTKISQSIIRSNKWIAHFDGETLLNVKYVFAGKEKTIPVTISPKPSEGCWYPFIHINDDLRLEIGLIVAPVGETNKSRKELLTTVDLDFTV